MNRTMEVFKQDLTTTQIPELQLFLNDEKAEVFYKWSICIEGFDLPLVLDGPTENLRIIPSKEWQQVKVSGDQLSLFDEMAIEKEYYIDVKKLQIMKN